MITLTNTVSPPPLSLLWDCCPLTVGLWGLRGPPRGHLQHLHRGDAQQRCVEGT